MEWKVFAIKDQKGMVYNMPFFQKSIGEAERSFTTLVNDPQSLIGKYPDDFDLYDLGTYEDLSGILKPHDTPRHVIKAVTVKHLNQAHA